MKKSVYLETSIVSYLTAFPSRDIRTAAWQQITSQWWQKAMPEYEVFTSELVIVEASRGDADAAARRLACIKGISELEVDDEMRALAERFISEGGMPETAEADALHVAIAAVHEMDYLLTWNCRHINNATLKPILRSICIVAGFQCPEICTPIELLPEEEDDVQG